MTVFANKQATLPLMTFDAVPTGHVRFPRLAEMYQRMPCQFLHVRVPLSIPRHDVMIPRYDSFSTQLSFTSEQDQRLISVTTVYSHGKRVLNLVEPLPPPRKISAGTASRSAPLATRLQTPQCLALPIRELLRRRVRLPSRARTTPSVVRVTAALGR